MAYKTIQMLKDSKAYKSSDSLKAMSTRQLSRFVEVYDAVAERAGSGGADEEQAESTAFAIAYSTARRMSASVGRDLEPSLHFFAAMAPEQFGGGKDGIQGRVFDFNWIQQYPDLASLAVSGNEFNWNHNRVDTALGQVRGLVLRKDAPQEVRRRTHKDIPFLFVASYYEDTDDELKALKTISAEWAALGEKDGIETPLPLSFAVTREPLNDPTSGIQKVASWTPKPAELDSFLASLSLGTFKTDSRRYKEQRATMAPKTILTDAESELAEQVASLEKQLEGYTKLETSIASLRKEVGSLKGLDGESVKDPAKVLDALQASFVTLVADKKTADERIAGLQTQFATLQTERATEKANEFASILLKGRRIKADAVEKWAGFHLKDSKMAVELAASLPPADESAESGKARGSATMADNEAAIILAEIDPRLALPKVS